MTASALAFATIEDYLGPAEGRFFGAGYKRATYDHSQVVLEPGSASGRLGVAYPADWSRKQDGVDLRPHLSTVDTAVVGAQYAQALVAVTVGLDAGQAAGSRVTELALRAGTRPEEDLSDIAVEATVRRTTPGPGADERSSVVAVSVGAMRVRCTVVHPPGEVSGGAAVARTLDDVLGPAPDRYWGSGFRQRRQVVTDVTADPVARRASATLHVPGLTGAAEGDADVLRAEGLGAIDVFVSVLQVAQLLLYEMDGLTRAGSSTLWMQQTTLSCPHPATVPDAPLPLDVVVTDAHLLRLGAGTWRNVQFTAACGGITQRSSFAHRIG